MNDDSLHVKVFVQRDTIELDVLPTTSVAELSQQILARYKGPSSTEFNRVRVIHRGRVLPAEKTLQQCNLYLDDDNDNDASSTAAPSAADGAEHALTNAVSSASSLSSSASSTIGAVSSSVAIDLSAVDASMPQPSTSATTALSSASSGAQIHNKNNNNNNNKSTNHCIILHAALSYVPPNASSRPLATPSSLQTHQQSLVSRLRPSFASMLASADARPVQTSVVSHVSSVASTSASSAGELSGADIDLERGDFYDQSRRRQPIQQQQQQQQQHRDASDDELDPFVVRRRGYANAAAAAANNNYNANNDDDTSSDEGRAEIADNGAAGAGVLPAPSGVAAAPAAADGYDSDEERETGGFDAFRRFGFSAADVAALRRDFHRTRPVSRAAMFRAEEQWLNEESRRDDADVQRGLAEDAERALRNGHEHDFVIGLVLGFSFSVLSVAFLSQRFVTRRGQVGIYLGILTNLMMGLSKVFVGFP